MNGALTLRDYPGDTVRLSCEKCGRTGQYRKATLIVRYGAEVALHDLRQLIAKCERTNDTQNPCGAHYEGLK